MVHLFSRKSKHRSSKLRDAIAETLSLGESIARTMDVKMYVSVGGNPSNRQQGDQDSHDKSTETRGATVK